MVAPRILSPRACVGKLTRVRNSLKILERLPTDGEGSGVNVLLVVISESSESESKEVVVNDSAAGVYVEDADAAELVKLRRAAGDGWETMMDG